MQVKSRREVRLKGIGISQGVTIGTLVYFTREPGLIPERVVSSSAIEQEVTRYKRALTRCKQDLKRLKKQLEIDRSMEACEVIEAHIQIMRDPLLTSGVEQRIRKTSKNAEYVFHLIVKEMEGRFSALEDPFFRERGRDLVNIATRILHDMMNQTILSFAHVGNDTIIFSRNLAASDVAESRKGGIVALLSEEGGATSHAAIVAKAKGIPYIANINLEALQEAFNTVIIVDGRTGEAILFPSAKTIRAYTKLQQQLGTLFNELEEMCHMEADTLDGYPIKLSANVEMISEVDLVHTYGANGVGLFRSEYIFLSKHNFPSEEEQYIIYRSIIERMRGLPITIRTFDVGGDKLTPEQQESYKGNPYLGCRAIRFLLKERNVFRTQLKAILRAAQFGQVNVMFPMISGLPELIEAKKVLQEARDELEKEGLKNSKVMRIGCMIEVPSAAMVTDVLAQECDFVSIGTNDLVQYSLAVDRRNQKINALYTPMHPGIIRLIKLIVTLAGQYKVPVSICGEIAADPRFTPLLIGLGVKELSVALRHLPWIKMVIRSTSMVEARKLAEKVQELNSPIEIQQALNHQLGSVLTKEMLELSPFSFVQKGKYTELTEDWEG